MTVGQVWDRILALVLAAGYARAMHPFDLELQPDTTMERVCYLTSELVTRTNFIGGAAIPQHQFSIFMAQKTKRDAWGAARQLKVDMDLLLVTVMADFPAYDYFVMDTPDPTSECSPPGPEKDFVLGRVTFTVDFDS